MRMGCHLTAIANNRNYPMRSCFFARLVFASSLSIALACTAFAQTPLGPTLFSPPNAIAPRVTQSVIETETVVLAGNVHPLATPEFDRGAVPDTFDSGTI